MTALTTLNFSVWSMESQTELAFIQMHYPTQGVTFKQVKDIVTAISHQPYNNPLNNSLKQKPYRLPFP